MRVPPAPLLADTRLATVAALARAVPSGEPVVVWVAAGSRRPARLRLAGRTLLLLPDPAVPGPGAAPGEVPGAAWAIASRHGSPVLLPARLLAA